MGAPACIPVPTAFDHEEPTQCKPLRRDLNVTLEATPSSGFRVSKKVDASNQEAVTRAVIAAKAGDMDAVRFLYLRYKDNVYGFVLSMVREPHEAEDITQQVFMKLMSSIHKYEPRAVPFMAWILRVARNVAIDHLRQRAGPSRAKNARALLRGRRVEPGSPLGTPGRAPRIARRPAQRRRA